MRVIQQVHKISLFQKSANNIELLRALAVIAVVVHHAQVIFGGAFPFLGDYGGQFGPQIFFLISGYLIGASCAKYSTHQYIIQRAFRILPAYWFFFLLFGLISKGLNAAHISQHPWELLANLLLLQQFFPKALFAYDFLHVSWTLTVELAWYIAIPIILAWYGKINLRSVVVMTLISTLFSYSAANGYLNFLLPPDLASNGGIRYLILDNAFISQFCFFFFGAYIYFHHEALATFNPLMLIGVFLLVFILKPYYLHFNPLFITGIGISFLMVACLNSRVIASRLVHWISEVSFSIYLCHLPIMVMVRDKYGLAGTNGVVVSLLITMVVSTIAYAMIERPSIRLGRKVAGLS
jgi:peptidoglycan/LPS O-acetylase OafA/YrhL